MGCKDDMLSLIRASQPDPVTSWTIHACLQNDGQFLQSNISGAHHLAAVIFYVVGQMHIMVCLHASAHCQIMCRRASCAIQ